MPSEKRLRLLLTAVLLAGQIIFLPGCTSTGEAVTARLDAAVSALEPEMPDAPEMESVKFEDRDGGLWISYNDYRALERNILALREWAAKLEAAAEFYREAQ